MGVFRGAIEIVEKRVESSERDLQWKEQVERKARPAGLLKGGGWDDSRKIVGQTSPSIHPS